MRWLRGFCVVLSICVTRLTAALASDQPTTFPALSIADDESITLNFPDSVELRAFVDYVAQRLNTNILYDEQLLVQRVTIRAPAPIRRSALLGVLQSALQSKNLLLVDAGQAGWKKIVPSANLAVSARPFVHASTLPTAEFASAPSDAEPLTQVFQLRFADVLKIEPILKPFLTQPGGNLIVLADQRVLVVSDFAWTLRRVGDLIDLVDRPLKNVVTRFVPVRELDAQSMAQQLSTVLAARSRAQLGGIAITAAGVNGLANLEVLAEPRTNQLILIGHEEDVLSAEQMSVALDVSQNLETQIYQFESITPERIDRLARDMFGGNADPRSAYRSTVDRETNRLLVTASASVQRRIAELKQQLDTPAAKVEQSPIRFYKLQSSTAADVFQTIQAIGVDASAVDSGAASLAAASAAPSATPGAPNASGPSETTPPARPVSAAGSAPAAGFRSPDAQQPTSPVQSSARQTLRVRDATVSADPNTNSIIIWAKPETQRLYEQLIRELDRRRPQVLIECTIVTLDTTNNFSLGVELSSHGGAGSTDFINFSSFGLSTVGKTGDDLGRLSLNPGLGFNGTIISSDVAQLAVKALVSSGRADVVSAPKLVVNDNTTGTLASVQEAPFTSVNASTTVATTSFAGYASAGTTIAVTPHISEGDFLQLEYTVSLNSFTGQGNSNSGTPPPRQTNQLSSRVTIPDGNTIIVGGLNRKNLSKTIDAVPILGQLPILEYLFSNRNETNASSTLFVFIRPLVLRDDQFADLKYLSQEPIRTAGLHGDYPTSEPLLVR